MNATAAPMALVGLGAFALIRWARTQPDRRSASSGVSRVALGVVVVAWFVNGGDAHRTADRSAGRSGGPAVAAIAGLAVASRSSGDRTPPGDRRRRCVGPRRRLARVPAGRRRSSTAGSARRTSIPNQSVRGSLAAVDVVGRGRGRAPADPGRQRHGRRTTRDRYEHRVRLGEDVHERLPHGPAGHLGEVPGDLPRFPAELPRRRGHDEHAREHRLRPSRREPLRRGAARA